MKKALEDVRIAQINHYYPVLQKGTDVRETGLIWVINVIQKLGEDIKMSMMPQFLDEDAIKFLFQYSELYKKYQRQYRNFKDSRNTILHEKSKLGISKDNIKSLYQFERTDRFEFLNDTSKKNNKNVKNKESMLKAMKSKLHHALKTSKYDPLKFEDPREQILAENIMQHELKANGKSISSYFVL